MKKYSSYFLLTHQSHLLLLLCVYPFSILAKPQYVFQSENPIANFAWEENDTSRNEQAYFCFNDSTEYINFGEFLNRNIIMPDNLHTFRINDLKYQLDKKAWNKGLRSMIELLNDPVLAKEYDYLQQQQKEFAEMGYHSFTTEEYVQKYIEALDYLQRINTQPINRQ